MLFENIDFLQFSFVDALDILVVGAIIYVIFRWIKGSSAMNIFLAILILLLIRIISVALGMKMLSTLMEALLDVGVLALIVIFQPEIRRSLNRLGISAEKTLGKRRFLNKFFSRTDYRYLDSNAVAEIAQACNDMAASRTGALIVIEHDTSLDEIIATGDEINSNISNRLLQNIFFKNSPLHDGAVIIGSNRIVAARCTLPITERMDLPAGYGMRHKAAVGISEICDADTIVVSEQTGRISFVHGGEITLIESINALKLKLGSNNTSSEANG